MYNGMNDAKELKEFDALLNKEVLTPTEKKRKKELLSILSDREDEREWQIHKTNCRW